MISIEVAKSGHKVLRANGRLLSSVFDPIKEASSWVDGVVRSADARETIVVLGAGSGYHIVELAHRRPGQPILVVDCDDKIVEAARSICKELNSLSIVCEPDITKLTQHGLVADCLGGFFRTFTHGASAQIYPDYYRGVEALFLGRDLKSFLIQLKARPELHALLNSEAITRLENETVSIKTIQKLFTPEADRSMERRMWRVLEELVV